MRTFLLSFTCLLITAAGAAAQITVDCVVKNAKGEPLGYATAYCPQNEMGVAADAQGQLSIDVESTSDSLRFSMLGYLNRTLLVADVLNDPDVILDPQSYTIQDIVVTDKNPYEPLLGTKTIMMSLAAKPGQKIVVKVKNPAFTGKHIAKVIAEKNAVDTTRKKKNKKPRPEPPTSNLRCQVMAVGEDGLPSHDLLSVNILADVVPEAETIEVDLSDYEIEIPENGIFVGFEWLPVMQAHTVRTFFQPHIKMTDSSDNAYTLIGRMDGEWMWVIFADWKKDLPFFISKKMRNAKIGIEVRE